MIEKIFEEAGLTAAQFAERMDIHPTTPYKWSTGDRQPSTQTLRRIEKEFKVRFLHDRQGNVSGFRKANPEESETATPTVAQGAPAVGVKVPASAREIYEGFDNYGGKVEWIDLPETERAYFEGVFSRMEAAIEDARLNYEHNITQAVGECRKLVRDRLLGIR